MPQGKFLYHLPFPSAKPLSVYEIMQKADVDDSYLPEILDIVELLEEYQVIEVQQEDKEAGRRLDITHLKEKSYIYRIQKPS